MKKASIAVLLAAVLLLTCVAAASAAPIYNLLATPATPTTLDVSWSAVGTDGPLYTVTCQAEGAERATERRTYQTNCGIHYLSPGVTYTVTVSTKGGATGSVTVTMPQASAFTGYGFQLLGTGLYASTANETDYAAFTALTAADLQPTLSEKQYHFMFRFSIASSRDPKYLDLELVVSLPNGDAYAVSPVLDPAGNLTTLTEYISFNSALRKIYADYGTFPAGEYTLTLYIDNGLAAQNTFTMQ